MLGQLAMELSLELMKQGSYQVEMSDEGLMTHDIEECIQVVVAAIKKGDLPAEEIVAWCKAMLKSDRVDVSTIGSLRNCESTSRLWGRNQPRRSRPSLYAASPRRRPGRRRAPRSPTATKRRSEVFHACRKDTRF